MADQFTQTVTKGFGQRILGSIVGIPIGLLLIVAGIGVLYWNEGRYDLAKLAKTATDIQASQPAPASAQHKLVAAKGAVTSQQQLGDEYLKPASVLGLKRTSEEYAWVEKAESHTQGHTGGSETTATTYTYSTAWTERVADSTTFKEPSGHTNPPKAIQSATQRATQASIGNYTLDFSTLSLPAFSPVSLSSDTIIPTPGLTLTSDNNVYKGANYTAPQVGDVRLHYSSLSNNFSGTVFGQLSGSALESFSDAKNHHLYRLFNGSAQDAVSTLHTEYRHLLWIYRGGGTLAVFMGLTMLLGPLTTLLSFFPTLGKIGSAAVATIALPVALVLSGATILIGIVAHRPIFLVLTLGLLAALAVFYIRQRGHKLA